MKEELLEYELKELEKVKHYLNKKCFVGVSNNLLVEVDTRDTIIINVGMDIYAEMSIYEAMEYIEKKVKRLKKLLK